MSRQRPPRVVGLDLRVMESGFLEPYTLRETLLRLRAAGAEVALWRSRAHGADSPWAERVAAALKQWQPDLVVVERVWQRDLLQAGRAAVPQAQWVRPAGSVPMPQDHLLDRVVTSEEAVAWVQTGQWPAAPPARPLTAAVLRQTRAERAPLAEDIDAFDLDSERIEAGRPSIRGPMEGCPFLLDTAANPAYAGVNLEGVQRKGCAYCLDNTGAYALPSTDEIVAAWMAQLTALRAHRGALTEVLVADERPHPHFPALMRALADRPDLHGIRFLWKSRVDWLVQFADGPLTEACELAAASRSVLDLYLIGFENFANSALQRMNKGVTVEDNLRAIAVVEALGERFAQAFRWQDSKGHGIILFGPWTTPDELRTNADWMRKVQFERFRSGALRTRLRLYPNLPLHRMAERDGLLDSAFETGRDRAAEQGYNASVPWRFAHRATAVIWHLCDQVGARLAPHQPESACLEAAVQWGEWLAPAADLEPVLAWRAWERAGRPAESSGTGACPDAQLAALGPGQSVLRSLPGAGRALAKVYQRLGFAVRASDHAAEVALTTADLASAPQIRRAVQPLDLHVWSLLPQQNADAPRWRLDAEGLTGLFGDPAEAWPGLRLTCANGRVVLAPLWPDPARWPDAAARRAQVERAIAWLAGALTPAALLPPPLVDPWPDAEHWPMPQLQVHQAAVQIDEWQVVEGTWRCRLGWQTACDQHAVLEVSLLRTPPDSPAAAQTDHRWLVHGALPAAPDQGWATLFRQLAAWWTACERGAAAALLQ